MLLSISGITLMFTVGEDAPTATEALSGATIPSTEAGISLTLSESTTGKTIHTREGFPDALVLDRADGEIKLSGGVTATMLVSGIYTTTGDSLVLTS